MPYKQVYMSEPTIIMLDKKIDAAIEKSCHIYKLEPALIRAFMKKESKFNPLALRVEPHLKKAEWYNKLLTEEEKKDDYSYCSMGLLQIMYGTAKHCGYKGTPMGLMNIEKNIMYSCEYIQQLCKKYWNIEKVISSYNQGSPRFDDKDKDKVKDPGENYYNQAYVDKVLEYYNEYGGKANLPDEKKNLRK